MIHAAGKIVSPLARRLIVAIVMFSSVVTLMISAGQLYMDYRSDVHAIEQSISRVQFIHLPVLTHTLWATNQSELQVHLDGILRMRDMQYVAVKEGDKVWAQAGKPAVANTISRVLPMVFRHRDRNIEVGKLYIVANLQGVYNRLWGRALQILVSNAAKTFLVATFIFFIFHRIITRHLTRIAAYLQCMEFPHAGEKLVLDRVTRDQKAADALDDVVYAVNAMTSEMQAAYSALLESEQRYRVFLEQFQGIAYECSPHTYQMRLMHGKVEEMTGYPCDMFFHGGLTWDGIVYRDDLDRFKQAMRDIVSRAPHSSSIIYRIKRANGEIKWVNNLCKMVFVGGRKDSTIHGAVYDITSLKETEESLYYAKEHAEVTLLSIGDGVVTTDAQCYVQYVNPTAENLLGLSSTDCMGKHIDDIVSFVGEDQVAAFASPVVECLEKDDVVRMGGEYSIVNAHDDEVGIEITAAPIRDRQGRQTGCVLVLHDVSESRKLAKQLNWQATHDSMTGLINRHEFEQRLNRAITHAYGDIQHALFYIDLDQFKIINDTCGHYAGDELLSRLSQLMQQRMRARDTLARLGGDEFGVLLEHCPMERALQIAEELRNLIRDFRFVWQNRSFDVSVSIGVVAIHAKSESMANVLAAADMACYAAKESGRNRVHAYKESDQELLRRHSEMMWVSRLTTALESGRFVLHAQSIKPCRGESTMTHVEILIRLLDEQNELVYPGAFIPAAERFNLMPAIDRWVIEKTFAGFAKFKVRHAQENFLIDINLSGASLSDDELLGYIQQKLNQFAILPSQICFEITETATISHLPRATHLMQELRGIGCLFALDDFGSGLSSFGYLRDLPVNYLKIDGKLVKTIAENPMDAAMVAAINDIGHVMGMQTIAEFVEDAATQEKLKELGVDYIQGYHVEMPAAFPAFGEQRVELKHY